MYRKLFICLILFTGCLGGIGGCQETKTVENTEFVEENDTQEARIWAFLKTIPQNYTETRVICLTNRQQYCYKNEEQTQRFVLEIQMEDKDDVQAQKEALAIGNIDGTSYVYQGEPVKYADLSQSEMQGILKIEKEENVLEWTQAGMFCRLYGTLSFSELTKIAEDVKISYE